jgi:hypothetical protein
MKRGRPATGKDPSCIVSLQIDTVREIDAWASADRRPASSASWLSASLNGSSRMALSTGQRKTGLAESLAQSSMERRPGASCSRRYL